MYGLSGLHRRVLDGPPEEIRGLPHQVLVERVLERDQHGQRLGLAAPRASGPLPDARHRPRIAHQHRGVEPADVDAKLERARADHADQIAVEQPALDLAPLGGQIAGAVGTDPPGERGRVDEGVRRRTGRSAR